MQTLAVDLAGVHVRLGRRYVLTGANGLTVGAGEAVALIGGNGSGKSTVLRVATGLIRPMSGTAALFGQRPTDVAATREVGAVIDTPPMYAWMSGRGVLLTLWNLRGRADHGEVQQALQRFRLHRVGRKPVIRYSQGMRKRLALAAASLGEPRLLVLDEPTNALDSDGRRLAVQWIQEHRAGGGTVLIASHRRGDVELCDRAYQLHDGRTSELAADKLVDAVDDAE